MPISFKSALSSSVANATFLDKTIDDTTIGKITMNNGNSTIIDDPQNYINELGDTVGHAGEGDANRKVYSSNNYIADGDDRKVAIGKLDAQAKVNEDNITSNDVDITALDGRVTVNEGNITTLQTEVQAIEDDYGAVNGLATLDGTGRIPSGQLPLSATEYKGTWNASTNTPTLADGVGTSGDFYIVSAAGTVDLGSGNITFALQDRAFYNGSIWEKAVTSEQLAAPVDSVFGRTGAVIAVSGDYDADEVDETATRYWSKKDNLTATTSPTVGDDSADNYVAGSRWYNQTTNEYYVCEDNTLGAAVWELVSGGGGSGVGAINYLLDDDTNFEEGVGNWESSDVNVVVSQETVSPLRGAGSLKIAKDAADRDGVQVFNDDITIDTADLAKKLTVSFDYDLSDANIDDGDWTLKMFNNLGTVEYAVNGAELRAGKGVHYAQFQTDHTEKNYMILIECTNTKTDAVDLFIDNIIVGPRAVASSAFMTDWEDFTPTGAWTTNTTYSEGRYRRVGDSIEVVGKLSLSGAPNTANLTIDMPNNFSIDSTKVQNDAVNVSFGEVVIFDNGIGRSFGVVVSNGNDTSVRIANVDVTNIINNSIRQVTATSPITFASGDEISWSFTVPIQGWSSNAVSSEDLGQREIRSEYNDNGGEVITANVTDITFSTKVFDLTASWNGTQYTTPETGLYYIDGKCIPTVNSSGRLIAYVNGVLAKDCSSDNSTRNIMFNAQMYLNKGDILSFRSTQGYTLTTGNTQHYVNITKAASPQTTLETETVAARYTTDAGQSIPDNTATLVVFEDLKFDTHNAMSSGGIYTSPVSGIYDASAIVQYNDLNVLNGEVAIIYFYKNGAEVKRNRVEFQTSNTLRYSLPIDMHIELDKGDTLEVRTFQNTGASESLTAVGPRNQFSIARIK